MASDDAGGRRHAGRVDLLHLVGVVEDVAELAREQVDLVLVELEIRERGDRLDIRTSESRGMANASISIHDLVIGRCSRFGDVAIDRQDRQGLAIVDRRRWRSAGRRWRAPGIRARRGACGGRRRLSRWLPSASRPVDCELVALIAPHAGLMYSGPVAAYAYRQLRDRPSTGRARWAVAFRRLRRRVDLPAGGFDTPLGVADDRRECASALMAAAPIVREHAAAHAREHSLEMQLPFLKRVAPEARIVPLVDGVADRRDGQRARRRARRGPRRRGNALLVASTDLSHYHDAATAARARRGRHRYVSRLRSRGAAARARRAARARLRRRTDSRGDAGRPLPRRARRGRCSKYADSGDVSGDKSAVVGYLAAALGNARATVPTPDA